MNRALSRLVPAVALAIALSGCASSDALRSGAQEIKNTDIEFQLSYFGVMANAKGEASKLLLKHPRLARAPILEALCDPKRYVAAHYILTVAQGKSVQVSSSTWNGLLVDFSPMGPPLIPDQRLEIASKWGNRGCPGA
jgi:hypothetical protein